MSRGAQEPATDEPQSTDTSAPTRIDSPELLSGEEARRVLGAWLEGALDSNDERDARAHVAAQRLCLLPTE